MLASKLLLLSALSLLTLADQRILNENDASNPLTPEIDSLIEQLLELYHVPGLSIAVIDNGNIASKVTLYPHAVPDQTQLNTYSFRAMESRISHPLTRLLTLSTLPAAQPKLSPLSLPASSSPTMTSIPT